MNDLKQLKKVMKQSAKKQQMFVVKLATTDFCKICPEMCMGNPNLYSDNRLSLCRYHLSLYLNYKRLRDYIHKNNPFNADEKLQKFLNDAKCLQCAFFAEKLVYTKKENV